MILQSCGKLGIFILAEKGPLIQRRKVPRAYEIIARKTDLSIFLLVIIILKYEDSFESSFDLSENFEWISIRAASLKFRMDIDWEGQQRSKRNARYTF